MLVVVSDLHFRDDPALSVSPAMTRGFLRKTLIPQVQDARARHLIVLFLGDIFDVNRCLHWADGSSGRYTPWSTWKQVRAAIDRKESDPVDTFSAVEYERYILECMRAVADANAENLLLWRALKDTESELWDGFSVRPTVEFRFVPGNHDRLVQFSERTRSFQCEALSIDHDPAAPFPWIYANPDYSVLALHGHVFDEANFGGAERHFPTDCETWPWYDAPSLGDVIAVKFGQQLPERYRQHLGLPHDDGLIRSLTTIDEVRPVSAAVDWLAEWRERQALSEAELKFLDRTVVELSREFITDEFVKTWFNETLNIVGSVQVFLSKLFNEPDSFTDAIRLFDSFTLDSKSVEEYERTTIKQITRRPFADWCVKYHQHARYLVMGHTHRPLVLPLCGGAGQSPDDERVLFNTGTWVGLVEKCRVIGKDADTGFVRRNQVAHLTLYTEEEDIVDQERSRWEFWMGSQRRGPLEIRPMSARAQAYFSNDRPT